MNLKTSIMFISRWIKRIGRKNHRSEQKSQVVLGEYLPEEIIAGLYPMNASDKGLYHWGFRIGFH